MSTTATKNVLFGLRENELFSQINEMAADKLLSSQEKAIAMDWFSGYRKQAAGYADKIEWLQRRLQEHAKNGGRAANLARRHQKKLRTVLGKRSALRKSVLKAVPKRAAGSVLSVVFLADDLLAGWSKFEQTVSGAN